MGILQQIRSDAKFLKELITSLRSYLIVVESNGGRLTGEELEKTLATTGASNRAKLKKLELILESGIIPDKYRSIITKQTYYPSEDELRQKSEMTLPPAKHSFFCIKSSRKKTGLPHSIYKIISDNESSILSFFMEHKEDKSYPEGGFGKIKQGSLESSRFTPKFAIKIYHKNIFSDNTVHELRLAMRAAYCAKQLGRQGYAFRINYKQYMVSEWLKGENLEDADQDEIQAMPIPRRIVMAISLLRELHVFHQQGLIHNDIKPSNVLVNFGKLKFVDFDSIRPKNEMPFSRTPIYSERFLPTAQMSFDAAHSPGDLYLKFDEKTDLFAMGITLAHLFQEIYIPQEEDREVKVNRGSIRTHTFQTFSLLHGPKYKEHPELQKLLNNMISQKRDELSTVSDYIDELKRILATYPDYEQYLDEDTHLDVGLELTAEDGEKAFREIEVELLGYNQRVASVNALRL